MTQPRKGSRSTVRSSGVVLFAAAWSLLAGCSGSSSDSTDAPAVVDDGTDGQASDIESGSDAASGTGPDIAAEPAAPGNDMTAQTSACELAPDVANGYVPVTGDRLGESAEDTDTSTPDTTFTYDMEANRFSQEIVSPSDGFVTRFEFAYDDAGRLTERVLPAGDVDGTATIRYEYEADLLVRESLTSEFGTFVRTLSYDDQDRLVAASRETFGRTRYKRYEYGSDGFIVSSSEGLTPAIDEVELYTEYTTDERGRITLKIYDGGGVFANEFDEDGNLVRELTYRSDGGVDFEKRHAYERVGECVPNLFLHALRFNP